MFHDLGLTARYRTSTQRFEMDGADAARDFLLTRGVEHADADEVWLAIALHTTPEVPGRLNPETSLLAAGVKTDVVGVGREDLDPEAVDAVTAAHPRPDFKNRVLAAFNDGMKHRPQSTFGTMNDDVLAHFDPTFQRETWSTSSAAAAGPSSSMRGNIDQLEGKCAMTIIGVHQPP